MTFLIEWDHFSVCEKFLNMYMTSPESIICFQGWKGKNKKASIFKIDFISKKYLILERMGNNFTNKMYHEIVITILYIEYFLP